MSGLLSDSGVNNTCLCVCVCLRERGRESHGDEEKCRVGVGLAVSERLRVYSVLCLWLAP